MLEVGVDVFVLVGCKYLEEVIVFVYVKWCYGCLVWVGVCDVGVVVVYV